MGPRAPTRAAASPTANQAAVYGTPGHAARQGGSASAWFRRIASEPLLHFTLLGALVFVGHHLLSPALEVPTIEVSASKQRELVKLFEQRLHRAPNVAEREQLIRRYVEDEALFREGVRMSLVHADPMLRAQMIARVRGMLQAGLDTKPPTEEELERYHDAHRAEYASPATISYREYLLPSGPDESADARRLLSLLRREEGENATGLPVHNDHSGYSEAQLIALYGPELARELWALPSGRWHELRSSRGVHVVRVDARTAASEPSLSTVRERLSADYGKARIAQAFQAELGRLTSHWHVRIAEGP